MAKDFLTKAGCGHVIEPPSGAEAMTTVGDDRARRDSIRGKYGDALKDGGVSGQADLAQGQCRDGAGPAVVMVLYVTMVYGPIAAFLVELFPTRIRYTSMSLPYHIGNGWFGGMLPLLAFAMVAANGNIYYGLWYPIVIAVMTFVIGMLFLRDRKDVDLHADESTYV